MNTAGTITMNLFASNYWKKKGQRDRRKEGGRRVEKEGKDSRRETG